MSTTLQQSQFQGALLGLAVGDALGAKWEGLTAGLIYDMGPADKIVEHSSGDTIYYSDDTQMTMSVVQTLIELGKIDEQHLAQKFAENYHPDRGYGQGARRIINAIGAGDDGAQLASTLFDGQGSLGNGAAMRVAPLGLFFAPDFERIASQAALSALPTHRHEIGIDGARIIAVAAALAAESFGKPFDRKAFLTQLLSVAKTEEFQWQISHALLLRPFESLASFGNSLEAHRSVMTSVLCFADAPDRYTEAIARAIGQGDDVDTLAAMTGALSGARLGISAISARLMECLEDQHQGRTFLFGLADALWEKHRQTRKQNGHSQQ